MANVGQKIIIVLTNIFRWCFGIFLALGGLINIGSFGIAGIFLIISALLMIPPITDWIVKKTHNKAKAKVIASFAFLASIIALGSTPTVSQTPTEPIKQEPIVSTSVKRMTPEQPKKDTVTPVIASNDSPATNSPVAINQPEPEIKNANADLACKVVGVTDGDTLTCLTNDKSQIKVRLNQIDAPEKAQAFGTAAKQALSGYVFGKTVGLKTNGTDKYGRTIAEVFVGDKNINKAMVADGYAWAYREYMTDNDYGDLETSARSDTKGLWSEPEPIYPSDFRRGKRGEQTAPVQTQTITQQVEQKAVADSGSSCGSKRYCKQMATCAEARHYLNDCGVSRLDRDGDGVPCESICN